MLRACVPTITITALMLAACAAPGSRPYMQKPVTSVERTLECSQIDLAIDRADTVRWMIRVRGGALESSSDKATRRAVGVVLMPLAIINPVGWIMWMGPNLGHEAVNASDQRIRELLQIKRAHGCPVRVTTLRGLNDMDVLAELEALQAKLDANSGDEGALFKERTRLLDGLRIVPPPAAATRLLPADIRKERDGVTATPASADDTKK